MRTLLPLALVLLAACQREAPPPAPVVPPASNLEALVHLCQEKTKANFTYAEPTGEVLRQHAFVLGKNEPDTPESWLELLRGTLAEQGLELVATGPERFQVWLIRRKQT